MDYQLVDMLVERLKYVHVQEELRPLGSHLSNRNSLEPVIRQPYLSPQSNNNSPISTLAIRNVRCASSVNAKATSNLYRPFPSPSSPLPDHSVVSAWTSPYHSAVPMVSSPPPSQSPNHSMCSELTTPSPSPSPNHSMVSASTNPTGLNTNWSPLDDAINASDPMSREDADNYIHMLLYAPTQSKRLPVFVDICCDCHSLAHLSLPSEV